MTVSILTSTLCKVKSVKNGVATYEIIGNELGGIDNQTFKDGISRAIIGKPHTIGKVRDIKVATKWIKDTKKLGDVVKMEIK
jgi:hypothetical protein